MHPSFRMLVELGRSVYPIIGCRHEDVRINMKQIGSGVRHASGRDRLLAMARDLFTRRGASNVGINDVTDAAGVAKMTLYNNFESKEALVLAVYKEMIEATLRDLQQISKAGRSEEKLILGVFVYHDSKAGQDSYRGCPFIHASLQDGEPSGAVYELVSSYKRTLREHMFGLLDKSRRNRAELADQLLILLDGAETERYLKGVNNSTNSAKLAARALLQYKD